MLAGGTPPDTFWVHSYSTLDWAAQKVLVDLTPYTKEKGFDLAGYYKGPVDDFRWEGQVLSLPRETSSLVMFLNKGQFAEAGVKDLTPDSTWNDWLDASRKLTKDGPAGKVFGTFASASAFNVFQMIWQNGGEIVNEKRTQSLLDSPQAIETVQFLVEMRLKHQVAPQAADYQGQTLVQFFSGGRMASYTTNQSLANELQRLRPFEWDAVAIPKNKQKAYAQASSGHGITRASKSPAAGVGAGEVAGRRGCFQDVRGERPRHPGPDQGHRVGHLLRRRDAGQLRQGPGATSSRGPAPSAPPGAGGRHRYFRQGARAGPGGVQAGAGHHAGGQAGGGPDPRPTLTFLVRGGARGAPGAPPHGIPGYLLGGGTPPPAPGTAPRHGTPGEKSARGGGPARAGGGGSAGGGGPWAGAQQKRR